MRAVILTRELSGYPGLERELPAMRAHFPVLTELEEIRQGDLVIPRFSLLPFPALLEEEILARGARLFHGPSQHAYLASLTRWSADLGELTPRSWRADQPPLTPGPYFVKGEFNSLKDRREDCVAESPEQLSRLLLRLREHPLLGGQGLVVRELIRLNQLGISSRSGLPLSEEYRFFMLDGRVLTSGFYWSREELRPGFQPDSSRVTHSFLQRVDARVRVRFYVLDVAVTEQGEPIVIELNDPSMSGLAEADPWALYAGLASALSNSDPSLSR